MIPLMVGNDQFLHFFEAIRFLAKTILRNNILPVTDLGIVIGMLGQGLAVIEINQLSPDRSGSNINGNGKILLGGIPGLNIDQLNFPAALSLAYPWLR